MSSFLQYGRVLSHGKVTDLSNGFKKNSPFSIYVKPLRTTMDVDVNISVRCLCDNECSIVPVRLNDWSPEAIVEIAQNAIDLTNYEVYWGGGNNN